MQPRLYLVCGLPGAGKTTRSHQIVNSVRAIHLCADEWVLGLGKGLMDFEFRIKLQTCLIAHAATLLHHGINVVLELGSWHREEREAIARLAAREGAASELHFLDAPIEELVRRVRNRGGPDAEALATNVLLQNSSRFEKPSPEEGALFDRYVGPGEEWSPPVR